MSQYVPPLSDVAFLLKHVHPFDEHAQACGFELDADTVLSVAEEAGKLAAGRIDPLNRAGDTQGAKWTEAGVTSAPGFADAYREFCAGGWNGLRFPEEYGGQGLCSVVSTVADEMWHAASMSFALCPMLTNGAVEALLTAGSDELREVYVPKLVSGEWTGTMNLTEPGAGSDLAAVQTKAVRQSDGGYRVTGQKIFITYGEHDMAQNIVHLVLGRTPDAPKGVKGISLFVVPKFLVNADGSVGERNDVRCASIEHKLGIHGSPTAVMLFGEKDGAVGYLVGEENRGLEYMFIMMNDARFSVGLQGLSISSRAFQHAAAYALERVQGRAVGEDGTQGKAIVRHPDVRRMLLSMKSRIDAMRAMAVYVAVQRDRAHSYILPEPDRNAAQARLELLIPVLKGWFTESAQRITYDGVQVFGGMGFVEETGAAQYYRDARILTIYEGTTAIQANDLVGRKTVRDGGQAALALLNQIEREAEAATASEDAVLKLAGARLEEACQSLRAVVQWVLETNGKQPRQVYAGSVPYLHAWGIVVGGWMHLLRLKGARAADLDAETRAAVTQSARYFAESELVMVPGLAASIVSGSTGLLEFPDERWVA